MKNNMKNLQEIIDNNARERATEAVKELVAAFRKNGIHSLLSDDSGITVEFDGKKTDLRSAFWNTNYPIPAMLIEKLTEQYIPEESKAFAERVEALEGDVEDLMGR